ncbi:MAG: Integrase family protein [uncultured bacterium]|nr:MAG: Integrase family protein [uncultured bacterium]
MGSIRSRSLKTGGTRYQAEVRLKGMSKTLTAMFDRRTDAKAWIQKVEADIRCGRQQLYSEGTRHTFTETVDRYFKEQSISVVKRSHLLWWRKELGGLYLQDVRSSVISEKKQKLLSEPTQKGIIRSKSTCNRFLATLSHVLSLIVTHKSKI